MTSETSVLLHPMLSNANLHAALLIFLVEHCVTYQKKRLRRRLGQLPSSAIPEHMNIKTLDVSYKKKKSIEMQNNRKLLSTLKMKKTLILTRCELVHCRP